MGNTVIFLGAGTSKADGAPLQAELFKAYFELLDFNHGTEKQKSKIEKFFKLFFEVDINNLPANFLFPTFEEALGVLDIAINRNESYLKVTQLESYRKALIFSMAKAIQYKLDIDPNRTCSEYHVSLVVNMLQQSFGNAHKISFISTNYDLLIDNAIGLNTGRANYGFNQNDAGHYELFKIHGSLNWLFCPVCNSIKIDDGQKSATYIVDDPRKAKCPKCKTLQRPVIVPPTYFKDMTNYYLTQIWLRADKALQKADHIIFCGYSFPDADIHIKYLLKRAELNRLNNTQLKITIMNDHEKKTDEERSNEKSRYKRFFSENTDVNYIDKGFKDLAMYPERFIYV
jgi:NAD-dependent SIR2 family protein deacetylase